ncbi:MAG: hypothetical protein JJU11_04435 [Candidatus Sumerlaeia bacterium]|nr:hypothetical protein [Candidatus Sumerlaeia bacterium]
MNQTDDTKGRETPKSGAFPFSPSDSGIRRLPTRETLEKVDIPEEELPADEDPFALVHGSHTPPSGNFRQLHISEIRGKLDDPPTGERSRPAERDPNTDPLAPFQLGQRDTSTKNRIAAQPQATPPPQDILPILAIAASCGVAIVGAVLWGVAAYATGFQVSVLAIMLGLAVGYTSMVFGGRGRIMGSICFTLALGGILAGKLFVATLTWPNMALTDLADQRLAPYLKNTDTVTLVREYMAVADDNELRRFMVRYGFAGVRNPNQVTTEHISIFLDHHHPHLMAYYYGAVERRSHGQLAEITGMNAWKAFQRSFGVLDMVFVLSGLALAFLVGGARDGE